jgi:hypothetical protein
MVKVEAAAPAAVVLTKSLRDTFFMFIVDLRCVEAVYTEEFYAIIHQLVKRTNLDDLDFRGLQSIELTNLNRGF